MSSIKLGKISIPVTEYASQGNAILGIRDSGKTYSATYLAERLMDADLPITVFDPIGVWKHLREAGAGRGYPVVVAGGEHGDLPLTPQSAAELMRAAMANRISLVFDLYDINLSKAAWKQIVETAVRTMLYENKKHGLRHIFIEEAAEFAPQRVGPDQGKVYAEIEKLARMGGNSMLGYTLINQRAEEVNKAVLELCDCLFLHRQKGRNSLTALSKWLDVGSVGDSKPIMQSLPTLSQGECWVWTAGSNEPVRVQIPKKSSHHPDRRQMIAAGKPQEFKAMDVSKFVTKMSGTLEKVIAQAKESDPAELRKKIAQLQRELAAAKKAQPAAEKVVERVEVPVLDEVFMAQVRSWANDLGAKGNELLASAKAMGELEQRARTTVAKSAHVVVSPVPGQTRRVTARVKLAESVVDGSLPAAQQRILDAIAWMETVGIDKPNYVAVAALARYSSRSSSFQNARGALRSNGLVEYVDGGLISLTDEGRERARYPESELSQEELHEKVLGVLDAPPRKILRALLDVYPQPMPKDDCASVAGYSPTSSSFQNSLGRLRTLGFVSYPQPGTVVAEPLLFLE